MYRLYMLLLVPSLVSCIEFRMSEEEFREAFSNAPLMPDSETIYVEGQAMHYVYIDQGHEAMAVFVHGSPGSWSAFSDYFKSESLLAGCDILAMDRPGFGFSDYGRPEPSLEQQAFLISEVLKPFGHKKLIWVGHSLGGPVIARMAMDYPELVGGLVMLAPSIDPQMEKYEWYRHWLNTKVIGAITPTDLWVSNEEILPLEKELTLMLPLWENITAETIVIHGTKDRLVPYDNALFARRMLPDSLMTLVTLEGINHFIPWSHEPLIIESILSLR